MLQRSTLLAIRIIFPPPDVKNVRVHRATTDRIGTDVPRQALTFQRTEKLRTWAVAIDSSG